MTTLITLKALQTRINALDKKLTGANKDIDKLCDDILLGASQNPTQSNAYYQKAASLASRVRASNPVKASRVIEFFNGKIPHSIRWVESDKLYKLGEKNESLLKTESEKQIEADKKKADAEERALKAKKTKASNEAMIQEYPSLKAKVSELQSLADNGKLAIASLQEAKNTASEATSENTRLKARVSELEAEVIRLQTLLENNAPTIAEQIAKVTTEKPEKRKRDKTLKVVNG